MGSDYLRGVLAACRVTGMLARLDLGEEYGNAPIILGTAGEMQAWKRNGPAAARRGRPPERGHQQRWRVRDGPCWHCGGPHLLRRCRRATPTMRVRLRALRRSGGLRRDGGDGHDPGDGAAAAAMTIPCATHTHPFGDMSLSASSEHEQKSEGSEVRIPEIELTDSEMPGLAEDPQELAADTRARGKETQVLAGAADAPQEEAQGAPPQSTRRGLRYLGQIHGQDMYLQVDAPPWRARLDTEAAPWMPSLPPSDARRPSGRLSNTDDVRQAMGYPAYSLRQRTRDAMGYALREGAAEEDNEETRSSSGAEGEAA